MIQYRNIDTQNCILYINTHTHTHIIRCQHLGSAATKHTILILQFSAE